MCAAIAALLTMSVASIAHASPIIFNDVSRFDFQSMRGAGTSPLAIINVSAPTFIDQIGVYNDLNSDGNLEFLIFNANTNALLFQSASQLFIDDGLSFSSCQMGSHRSRCCPASTTRSEPSPM